MKSLTTLLNLANGAKLYAEIEERCKENNKTINDLCRASQVSVATLWRLKKAKYVANLKPLVKMESTFSKWEKKTAQSSDLSMSSGVMPSARQ